MVKIQQICPPLKVSGKTSFILSFPYDETIIQAVKSIPIHVYHKKFQIWEIPEIYFAVCLDALTVLADIKLKLLPDDYFNRDSLAPLTQEEIKDFKADPFPHQIEAVNFMLHQNKSLLLDGCGVGKSLQMILYAQTLKKRGLIQHCLVITGIAGLRVNWQREINKFSNQRALVVGRKISRYGRVFYESLPKRAQQLQNKIDQFFVLLNVEAFRDTKITQAILNSQNNFGLIAFDEAHKIGAPDTTQFKNLMKLTSPFKVAATGTLIVNNPISSFGSLRFTDNDQATLTNFKAQYCEFGGFSNHQIVGYKNLPYLRYVIQDCSIRRTLFDVRKDIPPLTIDTEYLQMQEDQQKFYQAIKQGVKEQADKIELKANNLLALTTRLRQATACPSILTSQSIESVKVMRALEYIQQIVSQGEKVVVFSMFKQPLYQLAAKLDGFRFSLNTGDYSDEQVTRNMIKFQQDPQQQVFLGSFGKCGTGYTLNSAMYMICIDTPYTYALFEQGVQRCHRVNNQRPLLVKVLVCEKSIDERVWQIVESKKELSQYLVDGAEMAQFDNRFADELLAIIKSL